MTNITEQHKRYTKKTEEYKNMIKNPDYTAEIVAHRCSVELSINGIPCFRSFSEANEQPTTNAIDWPLNLMILENGIQNFEYKVMPRKGETIILEKALIRIKIVVREAIEEYVPQEEIYQEVEINFSDKKGLPSYSHKGKFSAKLPYKIEGWKNSMDLSNENQENLFNEIIQWNRKIRDIYAQANKEEYIKVFKERNQEINKCLYINTNEAEQSPNFNPKYQDLIALPNTNYKLELFANGKLASVRMPYELPGFRYDPKVINEDALGFSLNIYFHRKKEGEPLTIIR